MALFHTYHEFTVFCLEDLKHSKTGIQTEDSIYLSPAMYSLFQGYTFEGLKAVENFVAGLVLAQADEDILPPIEPIIDFAASGRELSRNYSDLLKVAKDLVRESIE